ncbi:MAG: hypothetical protein AAGA56_23895, partial [Myxococcota bacterium]
MRPLKQSYRTPQHPSRVGSDGPRPGHQDGLRPPCGRPNRLACGGLSAYHLAMKARARRWWLSA